MPNNMITRPVSSINSANPWGGSGSGREPVVARLLNFDGKPITGTRPMTDPKTGFVNARLIESRGTNEALVDISGRPFLIRSRTPIPVQPQLTIRFMADEELDGSTDTPETNTTALMQRAAMVALAQRTATASRTQQGTTIADLQRNLGDAKLKVSGTARLLSNLAAPQHEAVRSIKIPDISSQLLTNRSALIASMIQETIDASGLFYESHVKAWAMGTFPFTRLLQEPQGRLKADGTPRPPPTPEAHEETTDINPEPVTPQGTLGSIRSFQQLIIQALKNQTFIQLGTLNDEPTAIQQRTDYQQQQQSLHNALDAIPTHLKSLIQDQIGLLEHGRLSLQGSIAHQPFQLEIEPDDDGRRHTKPGVAARSWRVTLHLNMTHLGPVSVGLILTGDETRITVQSGEESNDQYIGPVAGQSLANALSARGLALVELNLGPPPTHTAV